MLPMGEQAVSLLSIIGCTNPLGDASAASVQSRDCHHIRPTVTVGTVPWLSVCTQRMGRAHRQLQRCPWKKDRRVSEHDVTGAGACRALTLTDFIINYW